MPKSLSPVPGASFRNVLFTDKEDMDLGKYIAENETDATPRACAELYAVLGPMAPETYAWSRHRPSTSWATRYRRKRDRFDVDILQHKKRIAASDASQTSSTRETRPVSSFVNNLVPPAPSTSSSMPATTSAKTHVTKTSKSSKPSNRAVSSPTTPSPHRRPLVFTEIAIKPRHQQAHDDENAIDRASSPPPAESLPAPPHTSPPTALTHTDVDKLCRRKRLFSADRAWTIHDDTTSVKETRHRFREMEKAVEACGAELFGDRWQGIVGRLKRARKDDDGEEAGPSKKKQRKDNTT
ncbi:hypothetical protein C8R46DRAFT_1351290 [Mycena filopes]|nr:hypothetical protein C8R46DRAFT_1351290 [Mycena filopes]